MRRRPFLAYLGAGALASALLGACGKKPPSFDNLDITDNGNFDTHLALPDTHGRTRTLADFRGKVVVLFFGYTQCPDVCPTSLAELAEAKKQLGREGARLQVVFVSVDPTRDTPAILAQYMAAFDPSFVALRPVDDLAVAAVTKQFHIYAAKSAVPGTPASGGGANGVAAQPAYTVDHTAASFVFDPSGKLRLYARDGQGVGRWVHDVRLLLQG
ncbi:SCO family protein [Robbsia sp. Bb-Pol-6]|uniref:SCO family protein n=1 Tax=Robbsia betulipollinis TaxID=2981849 RepID=A0ABT3ZL27_9BURK|nr:SCO family protein [Robbsia betulipollinis]MCY0387162.1 SCO family protein [Robbsia betulipollinis]